MPKSGKPRSKLGTITPAKSYRRASRILTRRHSARRRVQIARKSQGVFPKIAPLFAALAKELLTPGSTMPRSGVGALNSAPSTVQSPLTAQQTSTIVVRDGGVIGGNENRSTGSSEELGDAGSIADASPEFRAEMGGLLAYYAARIAAARRGGSSASVSAIVQGIMNEQTAAVRALTERWQAASEKQRAERPQRPTGIAQRKDDDPKPS